MSRYIDAERFKLWLQENYVLYDGDRYFNDIDAQPTADVVEVVRCKDCTFWKTETEPVGIECESGETAHYCKLDGMISRSGDFCSYGERRENGSEL